MELPQCDSGTHGWRLLPYVVAVAGRVAFWLAVTERVRRRVFCVIVWSWFRFSLLELRTA